VTTAVVVWSTRGVDQAALTAAVTPAVATAIDGVRRAFADVLVHAWTSGQGGASVVIDDLELGPVWTPARSWLGFMVSYLHLETDCYPHYISQEVRRIDGEPLKAPFHAGQTFDGSPAIMVSRRSPGRDPLLDTPARKTQSVLQFIRSQL
jgi:hypothetical protein